MTQKDPMVKAYDNHEFLHGHSARPLRVLAEFIEPEERLAQHGIYHTVVLFDKAFWNEVISFQALQEYGVIMPEDAKLFKILDDVDEAFDYITDRLKTRYL